MSQKGGHSRIMFHKGHCSPSSDTSNGSCMDDDLIISVATIINKLKKKNPMLDHICCKDDTQTIHDCICKNIRKISGCESEACILTVREIIDNLGNKSDDFKNSFRPVMPDKWINNYNEWLTTSQIENVLNQYMDGDNSFYFYGAVPIDFSNCSVSNLCSIDLKKHLNKGHNKIGIVFNTDPHTKGGRHWISMYIDLLGKSMKKTPCIYYFDSYGRKPPDEIKNLIKELLKQSNKYKLNLKYLYNDDKYQNKESQCGVYSIYFVEQMLSGKSFRKVLNHKLNDNKMIDFRNKYFIKL